MFKKNDCHAEAICKNWPGYYDCYCREGFWGNGVTVCDGGFSVFLDHRPFTGRYQLAFF
jgi:hypothetical protein